MNLKGGANFCNDVLFLTKSNIFKGSIAIILFFQFNTTNLEHHEIIIAKKVQYITIKLSPLLKVGTMCIYAQNFTCR
jgi:hypothetical protein